MTKFITQVSPQSAATTFKRIVRSVFTFDPVAARMLEDTFVSVHLNSRIWMV